MSPRPSKLGSLNRAVKLINAEALGWAFAHPSSTRYYIREEGGRHSIRGLCLRVGARVVWFGHRQGGGWTPIVQAQPEMSPVEIDKARRQVREALTEAQDRPVGQAAPARAARMTVRELGETYLQDLETTRGDRRSPRTLEGYRDLWRLHLVPLIGDLRLNQVTPDTVREVKLKIPQSVQARQHPVEGRPIAAKAGGRIVTNRALQQAEAAWSYAVRMEWVNRNPWSEKVVDRYDEEPDQHILSVDDYAVLGAALRDAWTALSRPRPPLPARSIAAIRVLLLTGARPGEVTPAVVSPRDRFDPVGGERHWCDLEAEFPHLRVPRAKGDRGDMKRPTGRTVYLPPEAVAAIRSVPRLDGSIYAFPGDLPNEPIRRLEKAWAWLLREAALAHVPLKTTRPSWRTHAVDAGLPPEHVQLLMGHAGLKITDTTYLKRLAPSLHASACKVGAYIAGLLGDAPGEDAQVLRFRGQETG
jgi:integrase